MYQFAAYCLPELLLPLYIQVMCVAHLRALAAQRSYRDIYLDDQLVADESSARAPSDSHVQT